MHHIGNWNSKTFVYSVWVVEVHTFLQDSLKDMLLEQSAHMLSDMLCSV